MAWCLKAFSDPMLSHVYDNSDIIASLTHKQQILKSFSYVEYFLWAWSSQCGIFSLVLWRLGENTVEVSCPLMSLMHRHVKFKYLSTWSTGWANSNTVRGCYNTVQYDMISNTVLTCVKQSIYHGRHSKYTTHISPSWVSYGMSMVRIKSGPEQMWVCFCNKFSFFSDFGINFTELISRHLIWNASYFSLTALQSPIRLLNGTFIQAEG